jgi:alpha/beta hydrolase family protein DUF900
LVSRYSNSTFMLVITLFLIVSFALSLYSGVVYAQIGPTKPKVPVSILEPSFNAPGYQFDVGSTDPFSLCPNQIVILVHGWAPTPNSALADFDRAAMSLDANNVYGRVVGFLWASETFTHKPPYTKSELETAFKTAAANADKAGHALAKYIIDSRPKCSGHASIYIAAHSLGTGVVKSALTELASNNAWKLNNYKIEKVFFLGGALPKTSPDIKSPFGNFIKTSVLKFYNLYSPPDKTLSMCIVFGVNCDLGINGATPTVTTAPNYADKNVSSLIIKNDDANGDGSCDVRILTDSTLTCVSLSVGANHLGYWGFWDISKHLINSGPMSLVTSLMKTG